MTTLSGRLTTDLGSSSYGRSAAAARRRTDRERYGIGLTTPSSDRTEKKSTTDRLKSSGLESQSTNIVKTPSQVSSSCVDYEKVCV